MRIENQKPQLSRVFVEINTQNGVRKISTSDHHWRSLSVEMMSQLSSFTFQLGSRSDINKFAFNGVQLVQNKANLLRTNPLFGSDKPGRFVSNVD